ncbi:hypothetical protein KM043_013806 [Ampulex compressa]|nr:hypothetical protein KM043_013806 [Ampulex compressa]
MTDPHQSVTSALRTSATSCHRIPAYLRSSLANMAASALEAKINKIRLQNEEIKRRYQEVEEDKKNAAKLNALVQMVPSSDWPERKEPPEFSNPPRSSHKPKSAKEKPYEYHSGDGKKGEGPPPDPKYNFLADSEREETGVGYVKENAGNKNYNRGPRGSFRKKGPGREGGHKEGKLYRVSGHRDEHQPEYEAWRAERNRIDEDRISRQRTAEGNWRREWDNDKMHIVDETTKAEARATFGEFTKKDFDRRPHNNGNDHLNYNRGGNTRPYRGASKNFHNNYDVRSNNMHDHHRYNSSIPGKTPLSLNTAEERTVIATDKSIKVMLNQGNSTKGTMMSVKVNSPSIAGTGRVGPRQRTRVTYSHTDIEMNVPNVDTFSRQKSFEDKRMEDNQHYETDLKSSRKDNRDLQKPYYPSKSPRLPRKNVKSMKSDPLSASKKEEDNQTIHDDAPVKGSTEADAQVQDLGMDIDTSATLENNDIQYNNSTSECQELAFAEQEKHAVSNEEADIQEITACMEESKKDGETEIINSVAKETSPISTTIDAGTVEQPSKSDIKDESDCTNQTEMSTETLKNIADDTIFTSATVTDLCQPQEDTILVETQNTAEKMGESANPSNENNEELPSPNLADKSSSIDNCDKTANQDSHEKATEESNDVVIQSTENSEQRGSTDNLEALSTTENCSVIDAKDANAIKVNVLTKEESDMAQCDTPDSHKINCTEPGECDDANKDLPNKGESQADDVRKENGNERSVFLTVERQ